MQDIKKLLFHDTYQKKQKWFQILKDPIWRPQFDITLSQHRQSAYKQLQKVANSGIVSVKNFIHDPTNIFTAHQMIGMVNGSAATKFTVHYNLFGGSIIALHTQRHKEIFQKIDRLQITGCFCLTQLGYGNNAVMMQTTATFDQKSMQFIINSPTVASQKYWITNGAIHANYALVFAQTLVKGKNQGVNAFLVPIRDSNLKSFPNVQINDMGYKIGLNGVDNASLKFNNVRIPRQNMMNKYSDVNQKGQFKSEVKGIQQRFFKVTQRLLSGRLCIASMTLGALKAMIYITMRYSQQRKGVSKNGNSQTPIFDYQLQQNALIPIIARTLGLNMLHNFAKSVFANQKGYQNDLLMICCVDKTLIGWHAQRSIANMRERCGGQGFLSANMFGQAMCASHAAMTAQGDNRVLMIKVVKDMLSIYFKNPSYYYQGKDIKINKIEELLNLKTLSQIFMIRQKKNLEELISKMTLLKSKGLSNYDILMMHTSDQIQQLATSYGQRLAMNQCLLSLNKLELQSQKILTNYFLIFALDIILRQLSSFILRDMISVEAAKDLKQSYNNLIKQASKEVDKVYMSMNVPSDCITAPIANDYIKYNSYANHGQVINAKM